MTFLFDLIENLLMPTLVGITVGLFVAVYGPSLRSKQERQVEEAKTQLDKIKRSSRPKYVAIMTLRYMAIAVLILILVGFFWMLVQWDDQRFRSQWTNILKGRDEFRKEFLFLKTIPNLGPDTCKNDPQQCLDETKAISRQELVCNWRASVSANQMEGRELSRMLVTQGGYKACMLEAGWFTESCKEGDEGCFELLFVEGDCMPSVRQWIEHGDNRLEILYCAQQLYKSGGN